MVKLMKFNMMEKLSIFLIQWIREQRCLILSLILLNL
jgi:hypothetical protein